MKTIHLDVTDSTNTYAKDHFHEFDPDLLTCVYAETQTKGRGRFQRAWVSPRSENIYATFAFRLPVATLHLTSLAQVMTLSLAALLLREEDLYPRVKWPNDVQLNGKKVSGVLCETRFDKEWVEVFLGIGVNVNMSAQELAEIDQKATSLREETDRRWDRDQLLGSLQDQFLIDLEKFKREGFAPFHQQFESLLAYKGQTVRCFDGKKEWVGICHSITGDGHLNLLLPNQEMKVVFSGDLGLEK